MPAGAQPAAKQLVVAGSGMGTTLRVADNVGAYTLTDEAPLYNRPMKRPADLERLQTIDAEALMRTYDWYLAHREGLSAAGVTHRVPWNQQALGLLKRLS